MITISIIEDNNTFRKALEQVIKLQDDFYLVDSFASAEHALKKLLSSPPDIVIVDLHLPGLGGNDLMLQVRAQNKQIEFLVCTEHADNETIFTALKSGAGGYILKGASAGEITEAIRDLKKGGAPMSPFIARKVIGSFQKASPLEGNLLSDREKQVLTELARGKMYKEIAALLDISIETVKKHLKNVYQKLQVQNKIEALNKLGLL